MSLDRFEADTIAVHQARRNVFLQIAKDEPVRCALIDALADEAAVFDQIKSVVRERLGATLPGEGPG
jgi:dTMP kinase